MSSWSRVLKSELLGATSQVSWAEANSGKAHSMITGPAIRAAIWDLRPNQTPKEENTQPSRKLVQGRQAWRSVSRSALLSGGTFENAIRRPCSAGIEEREISRTARGDGDVSIVRLHRSLQRDYSFRHERPHFVLKSALDNSRLSGGVLHLQQFSRQNTLRKSAIQRLHVEKCGAQNERLAVSLGRQRTSLLPRLFRD